QPVGQIHNLWSRTVIPDQLYLSGVRELLAKVQQIIGGSSSKGINGLGGIPHHTKIIAIPQPRFQQTVLQRRYVLKFVDEKDPILVPNGSCNARFRLQNAHQNQQNVFKINEGTI